MRTTVRNHFPGIWKVLFHLRWSTWPRVRLTVQHAIIMLQKPFESRKSRFSRYYRSNYWGDRESVSGIGSRISEAGALIDFLPKFIDQKAIKSLLDIPCGDFNWMRHVDLKDCQYIGADIVAHMIHENRRRFSNHQRQFVELDLANDTLPQTDVILCRDCFIHFSNSLIKRSLRNIKKSGATYLMTTSFPSMQENIDIKTGGLRGLNLQKPPFNLPVPFDCLLESSSEYEAKSLLIYRVEDIPDF